MQKQISPVLYFFKGALHYKWTAMVIIWVLCLCGWVYVSAIPNNYTSEAKIKIHPPILMYKDDFSLERNYKEMLRVTKALLLTKENLDQIIGLSGLEKTVKDEKEHEALTARLKRNIQITAHDFSEAYIILIISYEDKSPLVASNVVLAILMCQHFTGHMVTQLCAAIRSLRATNSH